MRSTSFSKFTLGRIWRDESTACGYHYVTCGGGSISTTDYQRSKLSCRGLFVQTISINERRVTMEPMEALKDVPLDKSNPKKFTRIGTSMEMKTK